MINDLPTRWVVEKDVTHPYWKDFTEWFRQKSGFKNWEFSTKYYGYTNQPFFGGCDFGGTLQQLYGNPQIITLGEWYSAVYGVKKLTAKEALDISRKNSDLDRVLNNIRKVAEAGKTHVVVCDDLYYANELRELGYIVTIILNKPKVEYKISWNNK